METTTFYRAIYRGNTEVIMEKKMETTITDDLGFRPAQP